jgi:predicted O-linked N-acetylglucosamine transferase (SPINDLY family)
MTGTAEGFWRKAEAAREAGRFEEAASAYRIALALMPDLMVAHANLAVVLDASGASLPAAPAARAVALAPDQPGLRFNLANTLARLGRPGTVAAFRQALALDPALVDAWLNLGVAVQRHGRLSEAGRWARRTLALRPGFAAASNNLGSALSGQGRMEEAMAAYERALAEAPGFADAARNRLCLGLYRDDDEDLAGDKARAFMRRFGPSMPLAADFPASGFEPERPLRIGLLSSDLGDHPVGCNLAGFFEHHDRDRISLAVYDTASRSDPASRWFRAHAGLWRSLAGLADAAIARQIRADGVDILVSLAGRFDLNRPLVLGWRPAPVQAAMHDGGASGMGPGEADEIEDPPIAAWITDRWLHPEGVHAGGDRLLRLPLFYNFLKPDRPPVAHRPDPAGVTFGSFSNPAKLSPAALAAWARILARLPSSRLVLKYRNAYGDPGVQARVQALIRAAGVDPRRLVFVSSLDPGHAHLERYGAIDIALDPFPFSGATTSFEALWMGVPVVTRAGKAAIGRTTAAILGPLGLEELIASSAAAYVERAVALAEDPERRARLRREIPERLSVSPLIDGKAYALSLEAAFRQLWRERCARQASLASESARLASETSRLAGERAASVLR